MPSPSTDSSGQGWQYREVNGQAAESSPSKTVPEQPSPASLVPLQDKQTPAIPQQQPHGNSQSAYRPAVPRTAIWSEFTTRQLGALEGTTHQGYTSITLKAALSQPLNGRSHWTTSNFNEKTPLSLLHTAVLDSIFSLFNSQQTTDQSGEASNSGGRSGATSSKGNQEHHAGRGKRKASNSKQGGGGGGDDDDNNSRKGQDPPFKKPRPSESNDGDGETHRTFACPFGKKDPARYTQCFKYELKRIRDVKQHLRRCHRRPIHCAICGDVFREETMRDAHLRERTCTPKEVSGIVQGMTDAHLAQLSSRGVAKIPKEAQWFAVWDIVFPGHPQPKSPYLDQQMVQELQAFQEFFVQSGPSIVYERLTEDGSYNVESLLRIIEEGSQRIADRWSRSVTSSQGREDRGQARSSASGPRPKPGPTPPAPPTQSEARSPAIEASPGVEACSAAAPRLVGSGPRHGSKDGPKDGPKTNLTNHEMTSIHYNVSHPESQNFFGDSFPISKPDNVLMSAEVDMSSYFHYDEDFPAGEMEPSYLLSGTLDAGIGGYEMGWDAHGGVVSAQDEDGDRSGNGGSGSGEHRDYFDGPRYDQDRDQGGYGSFWPGEPSGGGKAGTAEDTPERIMHMIPIRAK